MKHSIRLKITLLLTAMIVLIIFLTWLINRTFLTDYYIQSKINILNDAYERVLAVCKRNGTSVYLSEEDTVQMERLANDYNIDIYVIDEELKVYYPAPENFGYRENEMVSRIIGEYIFLDEEIIESKVPLEKTDNYWIFRQHDKYMETDYIDLVDTDLMDIGLAEIFFGAYKFPRSSEQKQKGDDTIILIRTNLESIEEGAAIANKFLTYVGMAAVLIGTIAMFFISRKFTKPIHELAGIAKRMSDLDFEVKYPVKTKDEIGELGNSINSLSDKLQTTISELKQANNELLSDIQKKTEIDEMRKEFLSNVSHELKTPISLIQGYAEGLKENINDDPESRDFYCEVIIDEANKMNQMVKKLLTLNELEFGTNQVNFQRFDIVELIRSVLGATDILFKQKEVILHFEEPAPIYVWADEYMVQQVVTNYISNALNHVKEPRIIEIKLIPMEDRVRIAVFNTGDNIPEEELDKIWIKFYKVDKARTREYGGNGIGLSIVKAIMNSLNQECGVVNRPTGVEFWFELDTKV